MEVVMAGFGNVNRDRNNTGLTGARSTSSLGQGDDPSAEFFKTKDKPEQEQSPPTIGEKVTHDEDKQGLEEKKKAAEAARLAKSLNHQRLVDLSSVSDTSTNIVSADESLSPGQPVNRVNITDISSSINKSRGHSSADDMNLFGAG
jgi:hypothetical protein